LTRFAAQINHLPGYARPTNLAEYCRDHCNLANQSGKRQSIIIVRERNGISISAAFKSEGAALAWIKSCISLGTVVNADEAGGWNDMASKYEMKLHYMPLSITVNRLALSP
jgi:hypothetical protein